MLLWFSLCAKKLKLVYMGRTIMITFQLSLTEYQTLRRSVSRAGVMIDLLWLSIDDQPSAEIQHTALECAHDDYQTARDILSKIEAAKKVVAV